MKPATIVEYQPLFDETGGLASLPPPLAVPQEGWLGLPICLRPLTAEEDYRDIGIPNTVVAVARSGRGQRWYSSGKRRRRLYTEPNMIEVIEAGMYFDRYQSRGEPGEVIEVSLPLGTLTRWLHDSVSFFNVTTRHEVFDDRLRYLLNLLWDEAAQGSPSGALFSEGLSMALLSTLLAGYSNGKTPDRSGKGRFRPEQRARLNEYIASSLHEDLSVERMSKAVDMSPYHFSRVFRATFGQPPYAYVLARRLDAACMAMRRDPARTLSEIALAFGFSSQAHFSEVFRRRIGTTPARWRRT